MALGWLLKRVFKFPAWSIPAICFNNTTALPLLLVQSLATSGILDDLLMSETDSTTAAVSRAKSYFLVSSMVGNSLTFAIGPKLLDDEETPDKPEGQKEHEEVHEHANGRRETDEEHASPINCSGRTAEQQEEHTNETTTLLPERIAREGAHVEEAVLEETNKYWLNVPEVIRKVLNFAGSFVNAPLIGAIIGATIGLVPQLHRLFLNEPSNGGIFKA